MEEERPNLFTTSLANIGPGETVAIQIEFQDKARLDNGVWSTRFPLVIAPRYSPKPTYGLTADRSNRIDFGQRPRAGPRPHHAARAAPGA